MTIDMLQRAHLLDFCFVQARHTGSLDCMKAVAYVLRNRLRAGWGDGTWLRLIAAAGSVQGNEFGFTAEFDAQDRILQMLARDIDDIYLGTTDDDTKRIVEGTQFGGQPSQNVPRGTIGGASTPNQKPQGALYYQFIDLPPRAWFEENILRDKNNHPRIGQIGTIALFR